MIKICALDKVMLKAPIGTHVIVRSFGAHAIRLVQHHPRNGAVRFHLCVELSARNNRSLFSRKDLPYVEAILKEVLRWHPIAPLGVPYRSLEEYKYRGMQSGSVECAPADGVR